MDDPAGDQSPPGSWRHPVCTFELSMSDMPLTITFSSDFENKFVCGEIMSYDDLKEYGSEASVKAVRFRITLPHDSITNWTNS